MSLAISVHLDIYIYIYIYISISIYLSIYIYTMKYYSALKRLIHVTIVDEPWKHYAKWNKLNTKEYIPYNSTYMRYLEYKDGEGSGTPLQHSCLENPMDGGDWWATVHGVTRSWTWLSDFTFMHWREKAMATHSSVLAWRIPGTGEPHGLLSMGSHRVGHDWSDLAAAAEYKESRTVVARGREGWGTIV